MISINKIAAVCVKDFQQLKLNWQEDRSIPHFLEVETLIFRQKSNFNQAMADFPFVHSKRFHIWPLAESTDDR